MSKKKNKFDLTTLVHRGSIHDGETLYFVSDPSKTCQVARQPNGECKLTQPKGDLTTVHAFVLECLGTEPVNHAANWLRTGKGKSLFELWNEGEALEEAA